MKKLLVTGSSGLIGSEVVTYFDAKSWQVAGVDNNMRRSFFGEQGDTRWNQRRLVATCRHFTHYELDIRERERRRTRCPIGGSLREQQAQLAGPVEPIHRPIQTRPGSNRPGTRVGSLRPRQRGARRAGANPPLCLFISGASFGWRSHRSRSAIQARD